MLFDAGAARPVRAALLEQAFHRRRRLLTRGCATKRSRPSAAGQHVRRRRRLVRPRRRVWQPQCLGVWSSQWMAALGSFTRAAQVCETMFADCHNFSATKRSAVLRPRSASAVRSILDSIVVSIPACHAGGRGSIPRQGVFLLTDVKFFFFDDLLSHLDACRVLARRSTRRRLRGGSVRARSRGARQNTHTPTILTPTPTPAAPGAPPSKPPRASPPRAPSASPTPRAAATTRARARRSPATGRT